MCDATNYAQVEAQIGSRIELIGQVHSVRRGFGANRKPYVFVNFSDWRGKAVKLSIWFDGMKAIEPNVPDDSWKGRWLSITGLVDPPYQGATKSVHYTHLSVTISQQGQIQQLTEQEAKFRLGGAVPATASSRQNEEVLKRMGGQTTPVGRSTALPAAPPPPPQSANAQVLQQMRRQTPASATPSHSGQSTPHASPVHQQQPPTSKSTGIGLGGWAVIILIGLALLRACTN